MARLACWVCLALGCWPSTRAESIIAALPKERRAAPWQSPLPAKAATRPAKKSNAILHMTQEACSVDDKDLFGRSTCNADEQKARLVHELLASSQDARSVESRLQASVVPPQSIKRPSLPLLIQLFFFCTMLNQRFFERIQCTSHKNSDFECYKAVYARSTMVLFSRQTRTPLASLTLRARDVGCLSMFTGRPSPTDAPEPYFQGMLNMPDQTFNFTITNLSDSGMINFNVLHTPHRVSQVDPGPSYGINQVNELQTNQSYTIEADQRNNRCMILSGKTKTVKDPITNQDKEVQVMVKEAETSDTNKGLYFYLSVVPDKACTTLVNKFAEGTVWKVVPGFVRRVAQPTPQVLRSLPPTRILEEPAISRSFQPASFSFGSMDQGTLPLSRGAASPASRPGSVGSPAPQEHFILTEPIANSNMSLSARSSAAPRATRRGNATSTRTASSASLRCNVAPVRASGMRANRPADDYPREMAPVTSVSEDFELRCASERAELTMASISPRSLAEEVDVGSTQAGKLSYGQRVDVVSGYTGHDYAYEHASEPTVLCMSIWEGMKFLPLADTIEKDLEAEIKEWVENEGKALIESLNAVFKSETCVIDLESEADTIVCTCGHQCIHHTNIGNLRKCPMCRGPITAFVKADGLLVE